LETEKARNNGEPTLKEIKRRLVWFSSNLQCRIAGDYDFMTPYAVVDLCKIRSFAKWRLAV
jgi:hypothetical protein